MSLIILYCMKPCPQNKHSLLKTHPHMNTHTYSSHVVLGPSASGRQTLSALIMFNSIFNRKPNHDEFISLDLCSSLAGAATSNHLSLQPSDPQIFFVHHPSSSLFSALIARERCPLWFCLHVKVLLGRECRKVSCMSVYAEDEEAAYSPAEDKPLSPQDMTYPSPAKRISVLSVNIIAKGRG